MNSRPMKHIDREDLYTNLEARVQYLHSFLDFSSRTYRPAQVCDESLPRVSQVKGTAMIRRAPN